MGLLSDRQIKALCIKPIGALQEPVSSITP